MQGARKIPSREEAEQEILDLFPVILANTELFIKYDYLYNAKPYLVSMSNPCGAPGLNIGKLCRLWKAGDFLDTCSECGGTVHIVGGSGNLAGGISEWRGYCKTCHKVIRRRGAREKSIYMPLLSSVMKLNSKK